MHNNKKLLAPSFQVFSIFHLISYEMLKNVANLKFPIAKVYKGSSAKCMHDSALSMLYKL